VHADPNHRLRGNGIGEGGLAALLSAEQRRSGEGDSGVLLVDNLSVGELPDDDGAFGSSGED
jgi:hypothetical protein